jgi:glucan 1,3-beta-glucosidase
MGQPWPWLGGSIALGLLLWWPARRAARSVGGALAGPLLAGGAALAIALQVDHAQYAALYWYEWLLEGSLALMSAIVALLALPRVLAGDDAAVASAADSLDWLRRPWAKRLDATLALGALQLVAMAGAAVVALGLDFDERYRDFPIWAFAVPAAAFALLHLRGTRAPQLRSAEIEICFASLLTISAAFIALNENIFTRPETRQSILAAFGPALGGQLNGSALIWCAMLLAFAYPWFAARRRLRLDTPTIDSTFIHS